MIELAHVTRAYRLGPNEVRALDDVTETIDRGEHVAIMGPSGSGKTTLLNVLGCLDAPTSGSYRLNGREVAELDEAERSHVRRKEIGFVFQTYHLVPRLDARANVELPLLLDGLAPDDRAARATEALEAVGLADRVTHRPSELSGGERQRVAIARALIMDPGLLLADEPTGNLDSAAGGQILQLMDDLHAEGKTIVTVTHDPTVARHADRVLVLIDGRIAHRLHPDDVAGLADLFEVRRAGR